MEKRNIIVIGASTGGFEAIQQLVARLPPDLNAAIFVVWHMAPTVRGVLPQVLATRTTIPVAHAADREPIQTNRIYVAPPDHHLLLEKGHVRITHGPKENHFRPAIDPLFRSAAYAYGNRVIGVILSGALDDGTAGLWTIKQYGGMALVQDPREALVPAMPESAIRQVATDAIGSIEELASLLVQLTAENVATQLPVVMKEDEKTKNEIGIAAGDTALGLTMIQFGQHSPYTCPDCHGVLTMLKENTVTRFRCHTGHAYSADALLAAVTEKIEDNLYSAIRGVDESVILLNHIGDHFAEANQPRQAALYFQKAQEAGHRSELVRRAVLTHQTLSQDNLTDPITDVNGGEPVVGVAARE